MASVVASFDSATAIGAVARINPASAPRRPSIRRPSTVTPSTVAAPASDEMRRAPKGLSPPSAVPSRISQ